MDANFIACTCELAADEHGWNTCRCPCSDCTMRLAKLEDEDPAAALDPRWRWQEIHQHGAPSQFVKVGCNHLEPEPVESGGVVVARLCLTCDQQLPA